MGIKYYQHLIELKNNRVEGFLNLLENVKYVDDFDVVKNLYNKTFIDLNKNVEKTFLNENHIFAKRLKSLKSLKDLVYENNFEEKILKIAEFETNYLMDECDNVIKSQSPEYIKEFLYYVLFFTSSPAVSYYLLKNPNKDILLKTKLDLIFYKLENIINNRVDVRNTILKEHSKIFNLYNKILYENSYYLNRFTNSNIKRIFDRLFEAILAIIKFITDLFSRIFNNDVKETQTYISDAPTNIKRFIKSDSNEIYKDVIEDINKVYETNSIYKEKRNDNYENFVKNIINFINENQQKINEVIKKIEEKYKFNVKNDLNEFINKNINEYKKENINVDEKFPANLYFKVKNNIETNDLEKRILYDYLINSEKIVNIVVNDEEIINDLNNKKDEDRRDDVEKIINNITDIPPSKDEYEDVIKTIEVKKIEKDKSKGESEVAKKIFKNVKQETPPGAIVPFNKIGEIEKSEKGDEGDEEVGEPEKQPEAKDEIDELEKQSDIKDETNKEVESDYENKFSKDVKDLIGGVSKFYPLIELKKLTTTDLKTNDYERVGFNEQIIPLYKLFKQFIVQFNYYTNETNFENSINEVLNYYKISNYSGKDLIEDVFDDTFNKNLKQKFKFLITWINNDDINVPVNEIKAATTKKDTNLIPPYIKKALFEFIFNFLTKTIKIKKTRKDGTKEYELILFDLFYNRFNNNNDLINNIKNIVDLINDVFSNTIKISKDKIKEFETEPQSDEINTGSREEPKLFKIKNIIDLIKNVDDSDKKEIDKIIQIGVNNLKDGLDKFKEYFNNLKYSSNNDAVLEFYKKKSFILLDILDKVAEYDDEFKNKYRLYKNDYDFKNIIDYIVDLSNNITINEKQENIIKDVFLNKNLWSTIFGFYKNLNIPENKISNKNDKKPNKTFPDEISNLLREENMTSRLNEKINAKDTFYYKLSPDVQKNDDVRNKFVEDFKQKYLDPLVKKARELIKEESIIVNNLLIEFYRGLIYFHRKRFEQIYPNSPVNEKIRTYTYGYKYFPTLMDLNNYITGKGEFSPILKNLLPVVNNYTIHAWRIIENKLGDSNRTITEINNNPHKKLKSKNYRPLDSINLRRETSKILWVLYSYHLLTNVFYRYNEDDVKSALSDFNNLYLKLKEIIKVQGGNIPLFELEEDEIKYFDDLVIKIESQDLKNYVKELNKIRLFDKNQLLNTIKNIKKILLNDKNNIIYNKYIKIRESVLNKINALNLTKEEKDYLIKHIEILFTYIVNPQIYINEHPNLDDDNIEIYKAALILILQDPQIYGILLNNTKDPINYDEYNLRKEDIQNSIIYNFSNIANHENRKSLFNYIHDKIKNKPLDEFILDKKYYFDTIRDLSNKDKNIKFLISSFYHLGVIETINFISNKEENNFNVVFNKNFNPNSIRLLKEYLDADIQENGISINLKKVVDELYNIVKNTDNLQFLEDLIKNTEDEQLIKEINNLFDKTSSEKRIFIQPFYHHLNNKFNLPDIKDIDFKSNESKIKVDEKLFNFNDSKEFRNEISDLISVIPTPKYDLYDDIKKIINYFINIIDKNKLDSNIKILLNILLSDNLPKTNKELYQILFTKYLPIINLLINESNNIKILFLHNIINELSKFIKKLIKIDDDYIKLKFNINYFEKDNIKGMSNEIKQKIFFDNSTESYNILNHLLEKTTHEDFNLRLIIIYLILEKIYNSVEDIIDTIDIKDLEYTVNNKIKNSIVSSYNETPEEEVKENDVTNSGDREIDSKQIDVSDINDEEKDKDDLELKDVEDIDVDYIDSELEKIKNMDFEEKAKMVFNSLEKMKELVKGKSNNKTENQYKNEKGNESVDTKNEIDKKEGEKKNKENLKSSEIDIKGLIKDKFSKFLYVKLLSGETSEYNINNKTIIESLYTPLTDYYNNLSDSNKNKLIEFTSNLISDVIKKSGPNFVLNKFYIDGTKRAANNRLSIAKFFSNLFSILSNLKGFTDAPKYKILHDELISIKSRTYKDESGKTVSEKENEAKFKFIYDLLIYPKFWEPLLKLFYSGKFKELNYKTTNKLVSLMLVLILDSNNELINDRYDKFLETIYAPYFERLNKINIELSNKKDENYISPEKIFNENASLNDKSTISRFLIESKLDLNDINVKKFIKHIFIPIYNATYKSVIYKNFIKLISSSGDVLNDLIIKRKDFYRLFAIDPNNNKIKYKIYVDVGDLKQISPDLITKYLYNPDIVSFDKFISIISKTTNTPEFKDYIYKVLSFYNKNKNLTFIIQSLSNTLHNLFDSNSENIKIKIS